MAIYPLPLNKRSPTMRRPDPYQHRARELCIADGVDPDSRIDRPGQRSMPAWCAYREAARKEQSASGLSRFDHNRGTAARRSLQPGQMKPSGQRRLNKKATQLASSENAFWNSESERALAIGVYVLATSPGRPHDTLHLEQPRVNGISHIGDTGYTYSGIHHRPAPFASSSGRKKCTGCSDENHDDKP